ncbi:MAG: NfeD family protein [Kosmotoga sp.]|nr:MAG: NfeD family protein [Kosmotoga sp.]
MEYIGWMIFAVVLLVIEIVTPTFFFLWFSIGSFIAGLLAIFNLSLGWQVSIFAITSALLVIFTRPIAKKLSGEQPRKIYVDELKGSRARVIVEINVDKGTGLISSSGEVWRAKPIDEEKYSVIKEGKYVKIEHIKGTVVYVTPVDNEQENKGGED